MRQYDAVVIGAGQGGVPLAVELAGHGKQTAIIESDHVGGSCINYGCTPTKTMIAGSRAAYTASQGDKYGFSCGTVKTDFSKVIERRNSVVESFRKSTLDRITGTENLDLIRGRAFFTGSREISIKTREGEDQLSAGMIFINTGARDRIPDIPGLDTVPWHNSASIQTLDKLPEKLAIIGGGYIGTEFGQMFSRYGSRVVMIDRGERLLKHEDPEVSEKIGEIFRDEGIELCFSCVPDSVRTRGNRILLEREGQDDIECSHLLVAAGRVSATQDLDPGAAGLETGKGGLIPVNERLESKVSGIWVLGDAKGPPAFTHISYDDYRVISRNLFGDGKGTAAGRNVPYTVYTDPELGRVGVTEQQAQESGKRYKKVSMPAGYMARAVEMGRTQGMLKALIDAESGHILGFTALAPYGGEIASVIQTAMMGGLTYKDLRDAVYAHPALSESLNNLFAQAD
ncbi:MAG: mercuric reductase [Spirochaetia bacterium]